MARQATPTSRAALARRPRARPPCSARVPGAAPGAKGPVAGDSSPANAQMPHPKSRQVIRTFLLTPTLSVHSCTHSRPSPSTPPPSARRKHAAAGPTPPKRLLGHIDTHHRDANLGEPAMAPLKKSRVLGLVACFLAALSSLPGSSGERCWPPTSQGSGLDPIGGQTSSNSDVVMLDGIGKSIPPCCYS